jgi:hypothetical protein
VFSYYQISPPKPCIGLSSLPFALHALPTQSSQFYHTNNIG